MYFCYVDESGDTGIHDPKTPETSGSPYFILAAILIHSNKWKTTLDIIKNFRKQLAAKAYIPYDTEFHCAELIDPRKISVFKQISVAERWDLIRQFAETIGIKANFKIIAVVIDKKNSTLSPENYLTSSITKLYQAYDELLRIEKENGIVLFDRANEKAATTHVRRLMGTGSSGQSIPGIHIGGVIEDPIYRISTDSAFIQAADVVAYTLKEHEFPITSRKKFNADRIFKNMLLPNCIKSTLADESGIIRA
jgi:hypothetical protein